MDEHIDEGIENTLSAFLRLFQGTNEGKMILKLA
jgi:NADPH-dependent curcumin reductase CurA